MRLPEQLDGLDGLVIPGGESTTIMRLMGLYGLDEAIRAFAAPIFGTCAGMIVLDREHLGLDRPRGRAERVRAPGRELRGGPRDRRRRTRPFRGVFIRAPVDHATSGPGVEILAELDGAAGARARRPGPRRRRSIPS